MTECQQSLMKLLLEIDSICELLGIDYYLAGGTFIGAIRHHGFLPWDDDADIHMTRAHAEKLLEYINSGAVPGRVVVNKDIDLNFPVYHWRYIDTASTCMLRSSFMTGTPQGQFIDIFVLDPVPAAVLDDPDFLLLYEVEKEICVDTFNVNLLRDDAFLEVYNEYCEKVSRLGMVAVRAEFKERLHSFNDSDCDYYYINSPVAPCSFFPRELWGTPKSIPFEDASLKVASYPEKILSMAYGERWFEILGDNEADTHTLISDYDLPYTVYEHLLDSRFDSGEYLDSERKRKRAVFDFLSLKNKVNPTIREYASYIPILEVEAFVERYGIHLSEWIAQKRYDDLKALFKPVDKYMKYPNVKYWGITVPMQDSYLYAFLFPYAYLGNGYSMVHKMMGRRLEEGGDIPDNLRELLDIADAIRDMLLALYVEKDYPTALELAERWLVEAPENVYFLRARIKLLQGCDNERAEDCLMEALKLYPADPELQKYKGDLYMQKGEYHQAKNCYLVAEGVLRNGIELLDLKASLKKISD